MTTNQNQYNNRRGVTLLVVLGLMTMFAMLVVAFMVITTQARRTAENSAKALIEPKGGDSGHATSSSTDFKPIIQKLLIGDHLKSVIGPYSILENLYGNPDFTGGTADLEGIFGTIINSDTDYIEVPYTPDTSVFDKDLTGNVLTIPAIGKSTFIIGNDGTNFILARNGILDTEITGKFIINSPAFSGTGPGFVPGTAAGSAALSDGDGSMPYALRPNYLAPESGGALLYKNYLENNRVLMNPDYTAPDYQNMFLAWNDVQYDSTSWRITNIIPSFHRPQLVKYHFPGGSISDSEKVRKIVLRPLPTDHPLFSGSNPAANSTQTGFNLYRFLTQGPWDVDNDGDGIADGIWLDLGLNPITDSSGKTYKPLVSFYVLDMDGRLNINVHGNAEHLPAYDTVTDPMGTGSGGLVNLRGSGYGPAEVRLDLLVGDALFKNILEGLPTEPDKNQGRYGKKGTDNVPGITGDTDSAAAVQMHENSGVKPEAYGYSTDDGKGGTIPDWRGVFPVTFDPLGNRYFDLTAITTGDIYAFNPYLMNPYQSGNDIPFEQNDLQYLIRSVGDTDYLQLPKRLRNILGEVGTTAYNLSQSRLILGTRSSDIPVFSRIGGATSSETFQGLYNYILNVIYSGNTTKADALWELLPEEIQRGEKVNLNRLTLRSDWTDESNHNALLKDKAKFAQEIFYLLIVLSYDKINTLTFPYEGLTAKADVYARLAQWSVNLVDFIDPDATMTPFLFNSTNPFSEDGTNFDTLFDKVLNNTLTSTDLTDNDFRLIWGMEEPEVAITETFAVHNRRVADSTKESATAGGTACSDSNCKIKRERIGDGTCSGIHDGDFDQVLIPEGSLFVELYRKGNPQRKYPANDLYGDDGELNLSKNTKSDYTGSPVWRLLIGEKGTFESGVAWSASASRTHDALAQAESDTTGIYSFQPKKQFPGGTDVIPNGCDVEPERIVWFGTVGVSQSGVPNDVSGAGDQDNYSFYASDTAGNSTNKKPVALEPNSYLIVAPRIYTSFQSKPMDGTTVTQFGVPDGSDGTYIDLKNSTSFSTLGFDSAKHKSPPTVALTGSRNMPSWASDIYLGMNWAGGLRYGVGLNVSEPLQSTYYSPQPTIMASNELHAGLGMDTLYLKNGYIGTNAATPKDTGELKVYGTIPCYKTIMLQRLADPTRNWNAINNPYITVDWNMIDLHVINSEKDITPPDDVGGSIPKAVETEAGQGSLYFTSRQWGHTGKLTPDRQYPNLWTRRIKDDPGNYAGLDDGITKGTPDAKNEFADLTLGYLNKNLTATATVPTGLDTATLKMVYKGIPSGNAFLHFPWHNAPFANSYEPMLVPASSPGRFGVEFYDNETANWVNTATTESLGSKMRYAAPNNGFGPYLNFFGGDLNLSRLFEYIRVPSKFAGTINGWIPDGSNPYGKPVYAMREPGKINLNTANEATWEALRGSNSRTWHSYANADGLYQLRQNSDTNPPSEFAPFRSPQAVNLVPTGTTPIDPVNATILRSTLLESEPDTSNPYTALESYMRLSEMTTTRSNVFAVWVTVGYFEVEHFADYAAFSGTYNSLSHITAANFSSVYPDGYVLGAEKGLNDGTGAVQRHRAFYLIDRSTPVGFRRGDPDKSPNYKDVIVGEKILE